MSTPARSFGHQQRVDNFTDSVPTKPVASVVNTQNIVRDDAWFPPAKTHSHDEWMAERGAELDVLRRLRLEAELLINRIDTLRAKSAKVA